MLSFDGIYRVYDRYAEMTEHLTFFFFFFFFFIILSLADFKESPWSHGSSCLLQMGHTQQSPLQKKPVVFKPHFHLYRNESPGILSLGKLTLLGQNVCAGGTVHMAKTILKFERICVPECPVGDK